MKATPWVAVAALEADAMFAAMRERFDAIALLPDESMVESLREVARAESELNDQRMEAFIASRLRVWLDMPRPLATTLASGFESACEALPADAAARRGLVMRTVRRSMSPREIVALHTVHPSLAAQIPRVEPDPTETPAPAAPPRSWRFWRRH